MRRLSSFLLLVASIGAGDARAIPYITVTLFGDQPAVEYFPPPVSETAAKGMYNNVIQAAGTNGPLVRSKVPTDSTALQTQGQRSPVPNLVIPGLERVRIVPSDAPLVDSRRVQELSDSRMVDEADEVALRTTYESNVADDPVSESGAEIGAAVLEAARAAREAEVDRTVQGEIGADLDEEKRLISFNFVELGVMGELVDEGGVLGLVDVTKVAADDVLQVNDDGEVVVVEDQGGENPILKWQFKARSAVEGGAAYVGDYERFASGSNDAVIQRLASRSIQGETTSQRFSQNTVESISSGRFLFNADALASRGGAGEKKERPRPFSFEQLWIFLRFTFARIQTYLGLFGLLLGILVFRRVSRARLSP